jgi:tRNA (cmo5U34)-methyltransferase
MAHGEHWKSADLVKKYLTGIRGALPLATEQIELMVRLIEATGVSVRRTLDLGCGNGILSTAIHDRFPEAEQTLVDFSEPMMTEARSALPDATVRHGDLGDPAWRDGIEGPFDAIVSGLAIHHLPDERKRALYAEIFDLLSPGAAFVHIEHVGSASPWLEDFWTETLIDAIYANQSGKTREQVATEYVNRPDKQDNEHTSVEAQCQWLRETGYTDVDVYMRYLELAVFGGRRPA